MAVSYTHLINKIDRPEARANEVVDEVLELFLELDADDSQLDCPFVFASAKAGIAEMCIRDRYHHVLHQYRTP